MAESECGVACHKKINKVGSNTLGCFTALHNCIMLLFELAIKPVLVSDEILCPLVEPYTGCSFTRTATADVIKGSKAVNPKTNLQVFRIH